MRAYACSQNQETNERTQIYLINLQTAKELIRWRSSRDTETVTCLHVARFRDRYLKQVSLGQQLLVQMHRWMNTHLELVHYITVMLPFVSQARPTVHASSAGLLLSLSRQDRSRAKEKHACITGKLSRGFDRWWEQRPAFASTEKCLSAPAGRLFVACKWFWFCPNGSKLASFCMHAGICVCWPHSTDMQRKKSATVSN